jgi:hypothetical protein
MTIALTSTSSGCSTALSEVTSDHGKLIDAIVAGVPAAQVKDRMIALDHRREEIEAQLRTSPAHDPIRIHPKMAGTYRERIAALLKRLSEPDCMDQAKDALRGLIERIVLRPNAETGRLSVELEGDLSGLMILALRQKGIAQRKNPPQRILK